MNEQTNHNSIPDIAITEAAKAGLSLFRNADGRLMLTDGALSLCADFNESIRRLKPDNLSRELLVRAAKLKSKAKPDGNEANKEAAIDATTGTGEESSLLADSNKSLDSTANKRPLAIDATAGFGEDSILLAAAGFDVVMYEYDVVIAALLQDALEHAAESDNDRLREAVAHMKLINEDSIKAMQHLHKRPDVILLDPMFPAREKSALIKKKFQLLQRLEQPCTDENTLLDAAMSAHPRKLVIKRPIKGPYLADHKPDYSLRGKAIRYDCIVMAADKPV